MISFKRNGVVTTIPAAPLIMAPAAAVTACSFLPAGMAPLVLPYLGHNKSENENTFLIHSFTRRWSLLRHLKDKNSIDCFCPDTLNHPAPFLPIVNSRSFTSSVGPTLALSINSHKVSGVLMNITDPKTWFTIWFNLWFEWKLLPQSSWNGVFWIVWR